jgi:hypothetical protein
MAKQKRLRVWLEGFAVIDEGESLSFMIEKAQSNRPWLNNILSRIIGKAWKIPVIPQLTAQIELIVDLLKAESHAEEAN